MADDFPWNKATEWWRELQPNDKRPNPISRAGNRAALARLRRCTAVAQAAAEPEALDLARRVGVSHGGHSRFAGALLTAIVLAHVRKDDPGFPVARRLGADGADQRAPMSALRLSRLLSADTEEERLIAFRRVVAVLGNTVNVSDLAHALFDWSEKTRIGWAFEYHSVPRPGSDAIAMPAQPIAGDVS
jgi:CRISPR system Cascade subunit CasB